MGATSSIPPRPPREFRFLLTPPRGGATRVMPLALLPALLFLLTPPHGGRPPMLAAPQIRDKFLLTPPRGGRRGQKDCILLGFEISTHAPHMGATLELKALGTFSQFLLTPRVGATNPETHRQTRWGSYFYSRPRMGGDLAGKFFHFKMGDFYSRPRVGGDNFFRGLHFGLVISTHAPAWGGDPPVRRSWR